MLELRISLLGVSRLAWSPSGSPVHLTGPARTLLNFLVLNRSRAHTRDRLAGLLWGDFDDGRARRCLNTALWRLRRSLTPAPGAAGSGRRRPSGAAVLRVTSGEVGFNTEAPHWLDVAVFEGAARAALDADPAAVPPALVERLEASLALYGGELLEDCDADWVLPERERLTELYLASLRWLMLHHKLGGAPDRAIRSGLRLLHADPLCEDVHRELIALYGATGQRRSALRQYDYCRDLLASELGVTPMPETEAVHRRILARGREPPPPTLAPTTADGSAASPPAALLPAVLAKLDEAVRALEAVRTLLETGAPPVGPDSARARRRP